MKSTLATVNLKRRLWQSGQHVQIHTGTGIAAQAATTSAFNEWSSYTIAVTFNYGISNTAFATNNQTTFSIMESNGGDQFAGNQSGFSSVIYAAQIYGLYADGGTVNMQSFSLGDAHNGVFNSGKQTNPVMTHIWRADCTETINNISFTQMNDAGVEASAPTTRFVKTTKSLDFTNNHWGSIGTGGYITIAGWKGNASASLGSHMDAEYGIIRVQVWKNTILTDDQCKNTIGGATGITSLINYNDSTYSYPQPNHEWIPELGNEDTISDTGSDTAVNLTYIGSPDIGYFRYGEQ
tara:strand:- start:1746 stop:2627 length:882 start_codon:yes stop_codon:yes gene_type:complete